MPAGITSTLPPGGSSSRKRRPGTRATDHSRTCRNAREGAGNARRPGGLDLPVASCGQRCRPPRPHGPAIPRGSGSRRARSRAVVTPHVMRHTAITKLVQAGRLPPPSSGSVVTRPRRWCTGTCTCTARISTRRSEPSAERCRNSRRTKRVARLHRNYTGRPLVRLRCGVQTARKIKSVEGVLAGGRKRNRTAVRGFAVLCIATLPSGRLASPAYRRASRTRSSAADRARRCCRVPVRSIYWLL